jgi:pimeloyl-ACP methyl ester carboxylesterase
MDEVGGERLQVPGASLFYQRVGSGPLLLLIQGGAGDADWPGAIIGPLARRYTVVTYDPRGLSRSRLHGPADGLTLSIHGDDAHRLLAHLADGPALVAGASRGAMVALDLVSRYPDDVATLVAHEPPIVQLLPEPERRAAAAAQRGVEEVYIQHGAGAAMAGFARMLELKFADREADAPLPQPDPDKAANLDHFLRYDAPAVRLAKIDVEALKRAPTRIVPAVGETNPQVFTHRATVLLAEALGVPAERFPGGHAAVSTHPNGFARRLLELLD